MDLYDLPNQKDKPNNGFVKIFKNKNDFSIPTEVLFLPEDIRKNFVEHWNSIYINNIHKYKPVKSCEEIAFEKSIQSINSKTKSDRYLMLSDYRKRIKNLRKIIIGKTTDNKNHNHKICIQKNDKKVVSGATTKSDDHSHYIDNENVTKRNKNHNHRVNISEIISLKGGL